MTGNYQNLLTVIGFSYFLIQLSYNSYHKSVAEKCNIVFTNLLCLRHRCRLLGHVISCDRKLSKPADCNWVLLLPDEVIILSIYGSRTKSPRTKPLRTKSPGQNPPGQNLPRTKSPRTKSPWINPPIISPQTVPLLNTFCFI